MRVPDPTGWPATPDRAVAVQNRLRHRVDPRPPAGFAVRTLAGVDVAYSAGDDRLAAAAVVLAAGTLEVLDRAVAVGTASFPYVPGLFAFRELPTVLAALADLSVDPDLLVCDGHGLAHPRRFGLACHLGVLTGVPTCGVAKTPFVGGSPVPGRRRGERAPLLAGGELVGCALRTQDGVRSVYVSVGHLIDLDTGCAQVLAASPCHRLPETTRQADQLSRAVLAGEIR